MNADNSYIDDNRQSWYNTRVATEKIAMNDKKPDLIINFPEMGRITLNLNALEPSIMIAIRNALVHTEDDAAEPNREINDAIEALDSAIKSSGFENE